MNSVVFENIYEKYSPMLYGIALQIDPEQKSAEQILIKTFKKIHEQEITQEKYPTYCLTLIHLILKTAHEIFPLKFENNIKLKQFESTPLLHKLICKQINLQDFCTEKKLKQHEGHANYS